MDELKKKCIELGGVFEVWRYGKVLRSWVGNKEELTDAENKLFASTSSSDDFIQIDSNTQDGFTTAVYMVRETE